MAHCLASKSRGTPQEDGTPGSDHPCKWALRLGVLNQLCWEGKWWAMPVFRSLWPHLGHALWSLQDAHCGGSHLQVHAQLHQVGCPPWILVNHSWSGIQPTHNLQQPLPKIPFPASSLWPCLLSRHLPEEDGPDPRRVPRMHRDHRWHHWPWSHWSGTWCPSMKPHVGCQQIWVSVQPTKNACKGPHHQFLWLSLQCQWCPPRPRQGWCCTHPTSANKCHQTSHVSRHGKVPQSFHPRPVQLDCPFVWAAQERCWLPGTVPMMLPSILSRMMSSVRPHSDTLTPHFLWPYKLMPYR